MEDTQAIGHVNHGEADPALDAVGYDGNMLAWFMLAIHLKPATLIPTGMQLDPSETEGSLVVSADVYAVAEADEESSHRHVVVYHLTDPSATGMPEFRRHNWRACYAERDEQGAFVRHHCGASDAMLGAVAFTEEALLERLSMTKQAVRA